MGKGAGGEGEVTREENGRGKKKYIMGEGRFQATPLGDSSDAFGGRKTRFRFLSPFLSRVSLLFLAGSIVISIFPRETAAIFRQFDPCPVTTLLFFRVEENK